ncbi:amidohydrolase family protein [Pseudooceanicola spongiae]|uniref:amidohydrolase family protein n=1 Tax=Pseudooceanicola spongiae TaxID=2613965 RepID=UPI001D01CBDF|nr:amidohydrolase family protein [Pseudooceanicola spongiae]
MDGTWPEIAVSCLTILVSGYLLAEVLVYGGGVMRIVARIALFIGASTVFLPPASAPGIAVALSSPGVQIFEAQQASALARSANDQLAEGIAANPDRTVGLAAFTPLDIGGAEQELERGVTKLGLRGGILNSHTLGT